MTFPAETVIPTYIQMQKYMQDGKWLRSCDVNGELLYWSIPSLRQETRTHQLRFVSPHVQPLRAE